jgi:hypothetical protein
MKARRPAGLLVMVVVLFVAACALPHADEAPHDTTRVERPQQGQGPQPRRPARQPADQDVLEGLHIAFDVIPWDHRRTTRYLLEVTDPAGTLTVHDLKRPRLRGRMIRVPLPNLPPGLYTFVVVAEGPAGTARSSPLKHQIDGK